jgi:hypothetical protein
MLPVDRTAFAENPARHEGHCIFVIDAWASGRM